MSCNPTPGDEQIIRTCEQCGNPTDLVSRMPEFGILPELRNYRCFGCEHVETDAVTFSHSQREDVHGFRFELWNGS
jgi:hypothetical protein